MGKGKERITDLKRKQEGRSENEVGKQGEKRTGNRKKRRMDKIESRKELKKKQKEQITTGH